MGDYVITAGRAIEWGTRLLEKCNLDRKQAETVVKGLVNANLRGVDTHGISNIRYYARRFTTIRFRDIEVVREEGGTCLIDAGDNYGILASTIAMEKAIEKAGRYGIGVVSMRNSNQFGAAAYYAMMASEKGMIGVAMTNAGPRFPPWGGRKAFLGTNPLAVAMPGRAFPVVLDMAFTTVAFQKIITCAREGLPVPEGWALDSEGEPTTDAGKALKGMLMPLGGYKGACLSVVADLLTGALSQNGFSADVQDIEAYDRPRKVGNLFLAVDIAHFLPLETFLDLIEAYSGRFHAVARKDGVERLYLPGEIEHMRYGERVKNGFPITRTVADQLGELSDEFGVERLI